MLCLVSLYSSLLFAIKISTAAEAIAAKPTIAEILILSPVPVTSLGVEGFVLELLFVPSLGLLGFVPVVEVVSVVVS